MPGYRVPKEDQALEDALKRLERIKHIIHDAHHLSRERLRELHREEARLHRQVAAIFDERESLDSAIEAVIYSR